MVGENGEPPGEATLGASKGLLQKLTASAKTAVFCQLERA